MLALKPSAHMVMAHLASMLIADRTLLWAAALLYLTGLLLGTVSLLRSKRHSHAWMLAIIVMGYVLQTAGLVMRGRMVSGCPLGNSFEILQFCTWSAVSLYLLIGGVFRLSMLGYFTASLTAGLSLLSLSMPSWDFARSSALSGANPFVAMHAGVAMFAYGAFSMLALTSALLLIRHYSLRSRRLGGWFSFLPPLVQLDQIGVRLLLVGVILMSVAMGVGYLYWRLDSALVDRTKLLAVGFLWISYSLVLLLRLRGRFVGRRFAWVCVLLYAGVLISLKPIDKSRHASPAPLTQPSANP